MEADLPPVEPQTQRFETEPLLHTWLWQPYLIVFISSACIMILELGNI